MLLVTNSIEMLVVLVSSNWTSGQLMQCTAIGYSQRSSRYMEYTPRSVVCRSFITQQGAWVVSLIMHNPRGAKGHYCLHVGQTCSENMRAFSCPYSGLSMR